MRLSFLVPLLGLALGPRTIVSNTITVAEVEEVTGATAPAGSVPSEENSLHRITSPLSTLPCLATTLN